MERARHGSNLQTERFATNRNRNRSRMINEALPVATATVGGIFAFEHFNRTGGLLVLAAAAITGLKFLRNR